MRGARAFGKATSARFGATHTQVQHHSTSTMFANKGQVSVCSDTKSTTLTSRHRPLSVIPVRGVHSAVTEVDHLRCGRGICLRGESNPKEREFCLKKNG